MNILFVKDIAQNQFNNTDWLQKKHINKPNCKRLSGAKARYQSDS